MEQENINLKEEPKVRKLNILKVISILFFVATFIMLLYGLIDELGKDAESQQISFAFYYVFLVIIFGSIGNGIAIIPAVIGLIYNLVKGNKAIRKKQIISFIVLTVMPILSQAFFILFCVLRT